MPGGGTKLGTILNKPKAVCLDVTRLVRRTGRVMTGVDRVEWAYLEWALTQGRPVFGLMRSAFGYLILDRVGLEMISQHNQLANWPKPDLLSRLAMRLPSSRKDAESALRRVAIARALPAGLARALGRTLPSPYLYFNTGHSNLTERVLNSVSQSGGHSAVLIHDMIPLTHPEFQKPGTVVAFERKMKSVSRLADTLICNSHDTLMSTSSIMSGFGRMPPAFVAHLGTVKATRDENVPVVPKPYVITVGTIEPRKNHALLLDIWEDWAGGGQPPHLVICGNRGWNNDAVFHRIEALKAKGFPISEFNGLNDGQMMQLVSGASAALFPSFAEGFGLPQIEAAQLGVPVICGDLAIYREVLGNLPVYVDVGDPYSWRRAVEETVRSETEQRTRADDQTLEFCAPTWGSHFNVVSKYFG